MALTRMVWSSSLTNLRRGRQKFKFQNKGDTQEDAVNGDSLKSADTKDNEQKDEQSKAGETCEKRVGRVRKTNRS